MAESRRSPATGGAKWGKKRQLRAPALILLFIAASLLVITTTGRLSYLFQPWLHHGSYNSLSVRLQLWDVSLELIKEHPLFGVGLGTFEPAYQQKLHTRFKQYENCSQANTNCIKPLPEFVFRDPHNWPLSFWLNTGLLGLASFTLINFLVIGSAATQLRLASKETGQKLITASMLALVALLLFGLTDTIYWKNDLSALHWIIVALLVSENTKPLKILNKTPHTS
jgi:O-antigen ligase